MDQFKGSDFETNDLRVAGVTVYFVDGAPSQEVIDAAHLCINRAQLTAPLTLRVRWAEPGTTIRSLRLALADGGEICAGGPDLLPALHKLCAHAASLQSASQADRRRWRESSSNRHSSGVFAAVQ